MKNILINVLLICLAFVSSNVNSHNALFENVEISSNCITAINVVIAELESKDSEHVDVTNTPLNFYAGANCIKLDVDVYLVRFINKSQTTRDSGRSFHVNIKTKNISYAE